MNDMRSAQQSAQQNGQQSASAQADARRAAERLAEAQRMMNGLRQQQSTSQLDDLSQRADRLADQQRDFANRLGQAFGRGQNGQNGQPGQNAQPGRAGAQTNPNPAEARKFADEKDKMAADLDQMEKDMQKAARDLAGTQPGASARVRDGLSDIQQNETKMRMQYSARFIRQGQGQFMVDREGPITQALDQMSKDLKAAQSALNSNGGEGGNKEAEQSLARLERLRSQMQQMAQAGQNGQGDQQGGNQQGGNQAGGNQAGGQQGGNQGGGRLSTRGRNSGGFGGYGRFQQEGIFEVPDIQYADPGAIVRDAQIQLNDLREQFRDNPDLGREIQDLSRELSRLQVGQTASPELDARIGREILPKLEALEVQLRRQAGEAETGQVRSGASDRVPAGYTDAVAEYFRKLSKGR